jgi:hypothetical protein
MDTPSFITLPSGRIINIDKLAFIYPAKEIAPGIRYSFGAQFNELGSDDAIAVLDALDARGVDTAKLRKNAGLPPKVREALSVH